MSEQTSEKLVRVDYPGKGAFVIHADADSKTTTAWEGAPFTRGWSVSDVVRYFEGHGATVEVS